jgi:leucyl aminopeptidase
VVDLATLTGACVVALGNDIAGMFTPNDEMAEEISKAAEITPRKVENLVYFMLLLQDLDILHSTNQQSRKS